MKTCTDCLVWRKPEYHTHKVSTILNCLPNMLVGLFDLSRTMRPKPFWSRIWIFIFLQFFLAAIPNLNQYVDIFFQNLWIPRRSWNTAAKKAFDYARCCRLMRKASNLSLLPDGFLSNILRTISITEPNHTLFECIDVEMVFSQFGQGLYYYCVLFCPTVCVVGLRHSVRRLYTRPLFMCPPYK